MYGIGATIRINQEIQCLRYAVCGMHTWELRGTADTQTHTLQFIDSVGQEAGRVKSLPKLKPRIEKGNKATNSP